MTVQLSPFLLTQLVNGQVSHAYIFSGPEAEEQALALAASLLCENRRKDGIACGNCPSCRHVAALGHPDCRFIEPLGGVHRTESMRDLVAEAGLSSSMGRGIVFILRSADKITEEAENTLLKLLEEPPSDTTLILLANQPDSFLPTIVSRCQMFSFGACREGEIVIPAERMSAAESFLRDLPQLAAYQVLIKARDFDKDKEAQTEFFLAVLELLLDTVKGRTELPFSPDLALRSATMMESCLDMLDKNVNQRLLTDVIYLRLWQNAQNAVNGNA